MNKIITPIRTNLLHLITVSVVCISRVRELKKLSPVYPTINAQTFYNDEYPMVNVFCTSKSMIGLSRVLSVIFLFAFSFPLIAQATLFSVTPAVIDGKGKVREILRYTITVENKSDRLISVYPWVADVDKTMGSWPKEELRDGRAGDLKTSLARWVEVTHGVIDLLPGDHKEIPVLVQINLNAVPGLYHAVIHFSDGGTRKEAEENTLNTFDTAVNVEVLEDKNIRLQLGGFLADKNFFIGDSASFSYSIENIGNRGVAPDGKIRIFDRKGEEVADVPANDTGKKIEPTEKAQLGAVWAAKGEFGRYKAMLDLEYGDRGTIQDTVFFWVLPWGRMLSYFLTLTTLSIIIALFVHSRMASNRTIPMRTHEPLLEERIRTHHKRAGKVTPQVPRALVRTARSVYTPPPPAPMKKTKLSGAFSSHRVTLSAQPRHLARGAHVVNLKRW